MRATLIGVLLAGWLSGAGPGRGSAAADDKPAPPAKGYELRIVVVGDTYKGVRFKPATGESWQLTGGRWVKLDEEAAPPAGDYDVTVIPATSLLALRLDRATGATWLLRDGKWAAIKEPQLKPGEKPAKRGPGYALRHTRLGDNLHVVRFHTKTGETWHLEGREYEPLGEFARTPAGDYDVTLISGTKAWMGFRIERTSGTTWLLRANTWHFVAEPE